MKTSFVLCSALVLALSWDSSAVATRSRTLRANAPATPQDSLLYSVNSTGDGDLVGSSNTCDDGTGHCTLRAAIQAANLHVGADGIRFNLPANSVVNLTHVLPDISESVAITSPRPVTVRRVSGGTYRVFHVTTTALVTFSGFSISKGAAEVGGALAVVANGRVNITNCVLYENSATVDGGGIYNDLGGAVTISNCTLVGNTAGFDGGGIYNDGTFVADRCSFNQNTAITASGGSDFGGGIANTIHGMLTVTNSTLSNNVAGCDHDCPGDNSAYGGGIYNVGTVSMTNSTFSYNSARGYQITSLGTPNTISAGGAICNNGGTLTLVNCTLSANYTELYSTFTNYAYGGGLYQVSSPNPRIENTIIAGNSALADDVAAAGDPDVSGTINSQGHNLIGSTASSSGWIATDKTNENATPLNLGTPDDLGGPTQTMPLLSGSAAIDAGDDSVAGGPLNLTTDQRGPGFPRKIGAHVDIGAFELLVPIAVSRKFHGTTAYDINLPFTGAAGIECRTPGANNSHQVIATFPFTVSSISTASVTTGTGDVSNYTINGPQVTINLAGVANAQAISITLFGVSDGTNANDVTVPMSVLLGDANGSGVVNSTDISLTKLKSGQTVDATNFRDDVTVSNSINATDVSLVKSQSGTALP